MDREERSQRPRGERAHEVFQRVPLPPTPEVGGPRTLGERLRHARERQGLPLPAVARTLRIPVRALEALERGAYDDLPATVYARGFVKLYAEVLGLDPVAAVREFLAERGRTHGPEERTSLLAPRFLRPFLQTRFRLRPRTTAILAFTILGGGALAYLFFEVRSFTRAPFLDVTEPPGNVEVQGSTVVVRGTTDPTADVRINGERTFVRSDGSFEETLGVREGVNTIRISAVSVGGREHVVTRDVLVRLPAASPSPPAAPASPPVPEARPGLQSLRLTVRADAEPVWVSLRADGEVRFSGILLPGSIQDVEGREVTITSGKGARTTILIDGEERGRLATTPGVVRDVVFTPGKIPRLPLAP